MGEPFPSPGDLPIPGVEPRSPTLQADSLPAESPGKPKNTGVGGLSLLQQIFLTQELNQGVLYCRRILAQLSYQGSPGLSLLMCKMRTVLILWEFVRIPWVKDARVCRTVRALWRSYKCHTVTRALGSAVPGLTSSGVELSWACGHITLPPPSWEAARLSTCTLLRWTAMKIGIQYHLTLPCVS